MNDVAEDRELALRLTEIGFIPGEAVRIVASGVPGREPLAVRLGHTTFALRRHEASLIRVVLQGSQATGTAARPTTPAMPSFGWNLGDADVANVLTYVRNSWGNDFGVVPTETVEKLR